MVEEMVEVATPEAEEVQAGVHTQVQQAAFLKTLLIQECQEVSFKTQFLVVMA
jgi:hypothetical protein